MKRLIPVAALAVSLTGCDAAPPGRAEIFTAVEDAIAQRYYDATFGGTDWSALCSRYRENVLSAPTDEQFYRTINEMLYELGVSHLSLIPREHPEWIGAPSTSSDGGLGLDVRIIDDEIVITDVREDSPAAQAGLCAGFVIERVDGVSLAEMKEQVLAERPVPPFDRRTLFMQKLLVRLLGPPGEPVRLTWRDGDGPPADATLTRTPRPGRVQFMEGLPPTYLKFESRRVDGDLGYIRFNSFHPALLDRLLAAVDEMQGAAGLVIDIRGNVGGVFPVRRALAERFVSERTLCWRYRGRNGVDDIYIEPAAHPYTGPLAILVDCLSFSSAEEFAGAMQSMGRATVIGERTPGIVLVADVQALPGGDTLVIPVAETMTCDDTVLEGRGVIPDIAVERDVPALRAGRDTQLEAAINHLRAAAR